MHHLRHTDKKFVFFENFGVFNIVEKKWQMLVA